VDEDLSLLASPDLSPRLLDNSTLSDTNFIETNYDATSSEEKMPAQPEGSNGEAGLTPPECTTARATTETPDGTMTPPSTEEVDADVNHLAAGRGTPPEINPLQGALIQTFQPGLSRLPWESQKKVYASILGGYRSSGGSSINMEVVMKVAYNQLEENGLVNALAQSQTHVNLLRQQKEFDEHSTAMRESTKRMVAAQELLIQEALKATECMRARMPSPSDREAPLVDTHSLLNKLMKASSELLEEKKRTLELTRELAAEKAQNKRARTDRGALDKFQHLDPQASSGCCEPHQH
jgi:hypothetical protein